MRTAGLVLLQADIVATPVLGGLHHRDSRAAWTWAGGAEGAGVMRESCARTLTARARRLLECARGQDERGAQRFREGQGAREMTDPDRTLHTRWSVLDQLQGRSAEDTWRWFIERYRPYILACLARRIQPRARAEQAAEEIWSYLFTSSMIENADRDRRFRTYLAGTVRYFALGWLRKQSAEGSEDGLEEVSGEPDPALQFEELDWHLWTRQVIQLALDELGQRSAEQAQALRWFYGLPASLDEEPAESRSASWIAGELGLEANAVHQLIFRGRKGLRSCIENELRETVRHADDLDDEMRQVFQVIEHESPGLGG